jgi:hypothetical protein
MSGLKAGSVEEALKELRELVGDHPQIIVDIRDCGTETRSKHGRVEYGAQIGMNGEQFSAATMKQVLAKVRRWRARQ